MNSVSSDNSSEDEIEHVANSKSERKSKKEKKKKKDSKKKRTKEKRRHDSDDENETFSSKKQQKSSEEFPSSSAQSVTATTNEDKSKPNTFSKADFFAQLMLQEGARSSATIGTIHAVGKEKKQPVTSTQSQGDWKCDKCQTVNMKYAMQCDKCRAMKRMTAYR